MPRQGPSAVITTTSSRRHKATRTHGGHTSKVRGLCYTRAAVLRCSGPQVGAGRCTFLERYQRGLHRATEGAAVIGVLGHGGQSSPPLAPSSPGDGRRSTGGMPQVPLPKGYLAGARPSCGDSRVTARSTGATTAREGPPARDGCRHGASLRFSLASAAGSQGQDGQWVHCRRWRFRHDTCRKPLPGGFEHIFRVQMCCRLLSQFYGAFPSMLLGISSERPRFHVSV